MGISRRSFATAFVSAWATLAMCSCAVEFYNDPNAETPATAAATADNIESPTPSPSPSASATPYASPSALPSPASTACADIAGDWAGPCRSNSKTMVLYTFNSDCSYSGFTQNFSDANCAVATTQSDVISGTLGLGTESSGQKSLTLTETSSHFSQTLYSAIEIINNELFMQTESASAVSLTSPLVISFTDTSRGLGPAMTAANLAGTWIINTCAWRGAYSAYAKDIYTFDANGAATLTIKAYSDAGCTSLTSTNSVYSGHYALTDLGGNNSGAQGINFSNPALTVDGHGSDIFVTFWGSGFIGFDSTRAINTTPYYTKQ